MSGLSELDLRLLEAEADAYRIEQSRTALRDALSYAAEAVDLSMSGEWGKVALLMWEAHRAADEAFPAGSGEAESFAHVLAFADEAATEGIGS